MSYLISIGIGPVQDFIASARRSRDLWFGSWLLSELSKAAANSIAAQGGELIFPKVSSNKDDLKPGSEFNVVNKILAEIEKSPVDVAKEVKRAITDRLVEIKNEAFRKISTNKYFRSDAAALQVNDLVEFFWTAVEHNNPQDYRFDRNKVEYLFSARKTSRGFKPVNLHDSERENAWSGSFPKSSLDGQRESVIREDIYDAVRRGRTTKEQLRAQFGVREGEKLCGVGLLKRQGNRGSDDSFFTTSHIASLPFIEFLERDQVKNNIAFDRYITELSRLLNQTIEEEELYKFLGKTSKTHPIFKNHDGHILYEERLAEFFTDKQNLESAKQALKQFFEDVSVKQSKLLPYYALLLADGDAMGKAIDAQKLKEDHQNLSGELSAFAKVVKKVVENRYNGSLIYAGGDDVLAFVPLHTVLQCAKLLSYIFKRKLRQFKIIETGETYSPTLSVGIAVAHHLEPLEDALDLARRAEKAAKAVAGKNALAVIVDKRSGTSRTLKGRWGTIDRRLNQFVEWHRANEIPDGAAYQLKDLANRLEVAEDNADKTTLDKIKIVEAKRILKRKKRHKGQDEIDEKNLRVLFENLKGSACVEQLADELIIAKIFAQAKDLAGGEKSE